MFEWFTKKWTRDVGSRGWGLSIPRIPTVAGQSVTHTNAQHISAYYAAIRNVSEDIGKIPSPVLRIDGDDNKAHAKDHPAYRLLNLRPNPMMTAFNFKELLNSWAQGWGNGFAEIVFDARMNPSELWPIHPARVSPQVDSEGKLFYWVYPDYDIRSGEIQHMGEPVLIPDWQMLHIKGPSEFGIWGKSVLECMAESLGLALASQKYGSAFYGNGAHAGGVLVHPNQLSEEAKTRLKTSLEQSFRGADRSGGTLVLEEGMKFETTTVNPRDAQALELRQFQVEEIARWFRIQPHKLQQLDNATYSNIESQNLDYVTDTLLSWTTRWEQEIEIKLLLEDPTLIVNFNFNFLLKGDRAARAAYYNTMHFMGALNVNEIRKFEDLNSIGDKGDEYYQQSAMVPLGQTEGQGQAFDGLIENQARVVSNKEDKACANEGRKDRDHAEWESSFWADQKMYCLNSFMPIISTLSQLGAIDGPKTIAAFTDACDVHYENRGLRASTHEELKELFIASQR